MIDPEPQFRDFPVGRTDLCLDGLGCQSAGRHRGGCSMRHSTKSAGHPADTGLPALVAGTVRRNRAIRKQADAAGG